MTKLRAALLMVLAFAAVRAPLMRAVGHMLPDASVAPALHCLAAMGESVLLFGGAALLLWPWAKPVKPGKVRGGDVALAMGLALLCRGALTPVDAAWQGWLNLTSEGLPLPQGWGMTALYIAALAIVPAVMEEAFFRGALLGEAAARCRWGVSILAVTLLFALMHGDAAHLPSALAISLLLTLLMGCTGRLIVPVAAHMAYNLSALWPMLLPTWAAALCGAALLAGVVLLVRRLPQLPPKRLPWPDALLAALALLAMIGLVN